MDFLKQLEDCISTCTSEEVDAFLVKEMKKLFNTPNISKYYQTLKSHQPKTPDAKLLLSWLAQLSGDNMRVGVLTRTINEEDLSGGIKSFYYDLMALSGLFGDPKERLVYSDKSMNSLDPKKTSFFHANAHLTRGQIHNGLKEYRQAYEEFYQAYEQFLQEEMMFAASVSLTNALLNKTRMAQFDECIKIGKQSMLMASSISGELMYWDVLYLPMGIAYLEQNHVMLALEYLKKAKKAIDQLGLIHMHGYLELYLFKAYKLHGDMKTLKDVLEDTKELFGHMRYPLMTQIIKYGELLVEDYLSLSEIEELKLMFLEEKDPQSFLVEMLVYLGVKNKEDYIPFDSFIAFINKNRTEGNLIDLQVLLLLLVDYYYVAGEHEKAKVILEETLQYKDKHHLLGAFYLYPYESWTLIEKTDGSLKRASSEQPYFTEKELEVLKLLEQGITNKEIGEQLFISVGTVKWHINHILSKLQVKNRVQAVHEARKMGIFKKD
jgi:LuxR family maltose regulon positive regulatory protein